MGVIRSIPIVLLLLAAPSSALAQTGAAQPPASLSVESVQAMLAGVEEGPGPAEWAAIGPAAVPVLAAIAGDREQPGFVRLRAIQAAGNFATPASRAMLRRAARSGEPLFARAAALALSRAFGAAARGDVAPLLDHADTAVREGAIRALGAMLRTDRTASDAIRGELEALLGRRLAREGDEVLRQEIQRQLSGGVGSSPG